MGTCLVTVLSLIAVIVLIVVATWIEKNTRYIKHLNRSVKKILSHRTTDAWQQLADNYDLTYVSGKKVTETRVFGKYRNYQLELKIAQQEETGVFGDITYMTLSPLNMVDKVDTPPLNIEQAKSLLTLSKLPVEIKGEIDLTSDGLTMSYTQLTIEYDRLYLQILIDYMCKLLQTYQIIVSSKSELIVDIETIARYKGLALQPFAKQASRQINKTTNQKETTSLICRDCLAHYRTPANLALPLDTESEAGCRVCNRQQEYFIGKLIAVLDQQMTSNLVETKDELRVNALKHDKMFDFDEIEIRQATDQEVERFVVRAGNEIDDFRKSRYKDVRYTVAPTCELSDNTHRILKQMFKNRL